MDILEQMKLVINRDECPTKRTPWFYKEVKKLALDKRKAYLQYTNKRTVESHDHYKQVRNDMQVKIKDIKRHHWEKFTKDLEHN